MFCEEGDVVIRSEPQVQGETSYTTRRERPDTARGLRVVHVEAGRHVFGGARQVLHLVQALDDLGVKSLLVCTRASDVSVAAHARGLDVAGLPMGGDLDPGLVSRLARTLREAGADVVHLHSRRGADTFGLLAARLAGVPAVLSRRVDNRPGLLAGVLLRHGYDRVICISDGIRRVLAAAGVPEGRMTVVPSAVDPARFAAPCPPAELRRRLGLPPDAVVVGMVAQLIPRKGHRYAFEALARLQRDHPRLHLVCFGSGAEGPALAAQVRRLGLAERVSFPGFRDDLPRLLGAFDLLVHPALAEGLGVALLEAAAAGCPMVATAVGGIPEIVVDGETGRLVPPGDVRALAEAMDALLRDPTAARELAAAARRRVRERHTIEAMAAGNLAVYQEVIAARRGRRR